jgi:hypothetical protein
MHGLLLRKSGLTDVMLTFLRRLKLIASLEYSKRAGALFPFFRVRQSHSHRIIPACVHRTFGVL